MNPVLVMVIVGLCAWLLISHKIHSSKLYDLQTSIKDRYPEGYSIVEDKDKGLTLFIPRATYPKLILVSAYEGNGMSRYYKLTDIGYTLDTKE